MTPKPRRELLPALMLLSGSGFVASPVVLAAVSPLTWVAPVHVVDVRYRPVAFRGLYQPAGGLPRGTQATAVITTSSGGQVAVICTQSNSTTFISYDGQ